MIPRLTIGIDLDGVLGNHVLAIRTRIARLNKSNLSEIPEITQWDIWEDFGWTKEEYWEFIKDGVLAGDLFWNDPVLDSQANFHLIEIAKAHDIFLVAARDIPDLSYFCRVSTFHWITEKYKDVPWSGVIVQNDKRWLGTNVFVEDGPHNLEQFLKTNTLPICFDQPWNQHWGGPRISSLGQLLPTLAALEQE